MIQYKDYVIQITSSKIHVRTPSGALVYTCSDEADAYEYIDEMIEERAQKTPRYKDPQVYEASENRCYLVMRAPRRDRMTYNNIQYFNGYMFKYNVANIKYLTLMELRHVEERYKYIDDDYIYFSTLKGNEYGNHELKRISQS